MFIRSILFLTIVIIAVQGEISSKTIKDDALKLIQLHEKYLTDVSGVVFYSFVDFQQARCPWMLKCCPNELAHYFSLMSSKTFEKKCMITSGNKPTGSGSTTCKQAITQFGKVLHYQKTSQNLQQNSRRFPAIKKWSQQLETLCSTEEMNACYCHKSRKGLSYIACPEKVLQMVAKENDGQNYVSYVNNLTTEFKTAVKDS